MLALLLALLAVQTPDLTVSTFNIRYGTAPDGEDRWERRRELLLDVLRAQDADVVGVQEALRFQLSEIVAALPEYRFVGVGREDGDALGEYAAILYRHAHFEIADQGTFWLSPTPEVPGSVGFGNRITRICTWARVVERRGRRAFYVFNVHLDHESQESRERAAELVAQRIAARTHADPVILLGDFNAGEENPARRVLSEKHGLRDAFRMIHRAAEDVGTYHAFRGTRSGEMIDAILVSAEWDVAAARIDRTGRDGRYPSDHFPVTARLRSPR